MEGRALSSSGQDRETLSKRSYISSNEPSIAIKC
jgi:hypothetical protein